MAKNPKKNLKSGDLLKGFAAQIKGYEKRIAAREKDFARNIAGDKKELTKLQERLAKLMAKPIDGTKRAAKQKEPKVPKEPKESKAPKKTKNVKEKSDKKGTHTSA